MNINTLNDQINNLKKKWNQELDTVNHYYWPIVAKLKREKKDRVWYFTISLCLLLGVVLWLTLGDIVNEYWIASSLVGTAIIIFLTAFFMTKTLKALKKENKTWQEALKEANRLQDEIKEKSNEAVKIMISELIKKGIDVSNIGDAYDDVLEYYNNYV